jgi:RNA polymerase sigma factor (sigma-70 family)
MLFKKTYTTEEIIKGCTENNRKFQEILYRMYFDKMYAMCSRYTNDEEETLSILNNGFLKVFQNIQTFEFKGSFEGWIRRIVYHSMVEFMRKRSRYLQFIILDAPVSSNGHSPEVLSSLYREDILSLMVHVPKASAKVFELYAIEGYNHREIGEMLGMSENTSKWHLANARNYLKKQLDKKHSEKNKVKLG